MKIAIVNDLRIAVESLKFALASVPNYEIAWIAMDGVEAVQRCKEQTPDLILMDLIMPNMNGVEAIRRIMKATPCAILVVTASVGLRSSMVFEAMGAGALDAVSTPVFGRSGKENSSRELLVKIANIAKLIHASPIKPRKTNLSNIHTSPFNKKETLIAVGCSTGGPQALVKILSSLPADFPASMVIIQHINEKFTPDMAAWLNSKTKINVRLLKEGDRPANGTALFPCTNDHAVLDSDNRIRYAKGSENDFYHPSVDIFFNSVAKNWYGNCVGVLLTGMGRDGAQGLLSLRKRGWPTIAQDEATSVVFGMPKAAISLDAAEMILPIDKIGPTIMNFADTDKK